MGEGLPHNRFPWVKLSLFLLIVMGTSLLLLHVLPDEWLEEEYLDRVMQQAGVLAPLAYIVLKSAVILVAVVPSSPLDVAAGAAFGPFLGTVYSLAGSELGAIACFYIARSFGQRAVARLFRRDISFCGRCAQKHLAYIIIVARLEPVVSFALVSYGAGLTKISLIPFAISTLVGMAPATILLNYYGKSFLSGNVALQILLGMVLVAMMFLVPMWIKRRNPGLYEEMKGGDANHVHHASKGRK